MTEQRLTSLEKAASPTTSPEELQRLAQQYSEDREILQAIVNNPNVPSEVLLQLGEHFPQEMLDNPVFNLLLLENPLDLVIEMPVRTILSLLQLEEIPSFLKQGITRHKERIHIAENRSTPASILEILSQDAELGVRYKVAYNPNTPVPILEILVRDADIEIRRNMAINPDTPIPILEILAQDTDDWEVRYNVARHRNTPVPILEILAKDADSTVRRGVESNPNTPVSILEILAQDTDVHIRSYVAINPNTPASILEILAQDPVIDVRMAVAVNPNTPASILEILAQDAEPEIRMGATNNLNSKDESSPLSIGKLYQKIKRFLPKQHQ